MILSRAGWGAPPEHPAWPADAVHVWRTTTDWPATLLANLEQVLSPDEKARVERFRFEQDRKVHLVSRGWLRLLLGRYLGRLPGEISIVTGAFGKPHLAAGGDRTSQQIQAQLHFNVSHSGELVVIALTAGRVLGVDVERIRRDMKVLELAERYFSPNERGVLAGLGPALQHDAFFDGWTRKEAYIKARGEGLSLPLDQFDVALAPDEPAALIATRPDPADACFWSLRAFDIADGYKAALAVEGFGWTLQCWDWPAERPSSP